MGILKFEKFKDLLPTDHQKEEYTWRRGIKQKVGFDFKVCSHSVQSAVAIVIRTIKHIPKGSNILRECPHSSLSYPACKAHGPFYIVIYGLACCITFFHTIT
jgi:hypothetical protein